MGDFFHVSKGAARASYKRVLLSILSLKDEFIRWPTAQERRTIQDAFLRFYGFPNCVGAIDGTYVGLSERPSWCGQDFLTRKMNYAVQALLICDFNSRITHVYYCSCRDRGTFHLGWGTNDPLPSFLKDKYRNSKINGNGC